MLKSLLLVDDEIDILRGLAQIFRNSGYMIHTAESGNEALDIMDRSAADLIITDMHMPGIDGYKLLKEVKHKHPNVLSIIMGGYQDEPQILNAIRNNYAKLFIHKPMLKDNILDIVKKIFDTEDMLRESQLLDLIKGIDELPVLKSNYKRILDLIEEDAMIDEIANTIERDQSTALKILQIANSAYYGIKTGSVRQAVSYLGLTNIRNLVLSTSVVDALNCKGIIVERLWQHSFLTNKVVSLIYEQMMGKKLEQTSMAVGLLHDVGKVVLLKYFGQKYLKVIEKAKQNSVEYLAMEKEIFNMTHQQVGGYLLKWWALPYPIVEAALYHHEPFNENIINKELVSVVHIADYYSWTVMKEYPHDGLNVNTFEALGLSVEEFLNKLDNFRSNLVK